MRGKGTSAKAAKAEEKELILCNLINNYTDFLNQNACEGFNFVYDILLKLVNLAGELGTKGYIDCYNKSVAAVIRWAFSAL